MQVLHPFDTKPPGKHYPSPRNIIFVTGIQMEKSILLILDSCLPRMTVFAVFLFLSAPMMTGLVLETSLSRALLAPSAMPLAFEFHSYVYVLSRAFDIYSYAAGLLRRCTCTNCYCGIPAIKLLYIVTVRFRWSHKTRRTVAFAISTRRRSGTCRALITTT